MTIRYISWIRWDKKKKSTSERQEDRRGAVEAAFNSCGAEGAVTVKDMAEYMGVTEKTARSRIKEHGGFWIDEGTVGRKSG